MWCVYVCVCSACVYVYVCFKGRNHYTSSKNSKDQYIYFNGIHFNLQLFL